MRLISRFTNQWFFIGKLYWNGERQWPNSSIVEDIPKGKNNDTLIFNFTETGLMRIEGSSCWNDNPLQGLPPVYYVEDVTYTTENADNPHSYRPRDLVFHVYFPETNFEAIQLITKYEKNTP